MTANEQSSIKPLTARVEGDYVEKGVGQRKDGYKPSKPASAVQPKPVAIPRPAPANGSKVPNS